MDKISLSRGPRSNRAKTLRATSHAKPQATPSGAPETPSPRRYGWMVRVAIGLSILGWLVWRIEWTPIIETFARVQVGFCVLALLLYCLAQVVSSYRWMLLAQPLGFSQPLARYAQLYFVGMFFNLFLPTSMGGDVVRAWHLGESAGRRWPAFLSVLSERLSGLLALMLMACAATLFVGELVADWAIGAVWLATSAMAFGCLLLPRLGQMHPKLQTIGESLSLYGLDRRRWWLALGLSLAVQMASVVQIWLLGLALGVSAPLLAYAVVVPLVTLATLVPVSLNGVGIREAGLVLLLASAGVGSAETLALGVLWLVMLMAAGGLGGAVCAWGGFAREPDQQGASEDGRISGDSDQGRARQSKAAA